ncbi:hypothetical protein P280DRAFT_197115 [Massarina eburnea CBS 473.64]|uniref:Zn(2)-C6 fungal-type domain-containing protein n=1 Tax=Massarina eburnea CBS 473.64 TaxID=1395130 RepID=A0A6A6RLK4_9PLEO|nr:hypothetical protein P280DRAFT_197115 [Massarina eburnea CBS 473.64]
MAANAPHTRTRTGCWTCREAGYKCDEQHPICGRCTRLNINCKGYGLKLKWKNSTTTPEPRKRRKNGPGRGSVGHSAASPMSTSSESSQWMHIVPFNPLPEPGSTPYLCPLDKRLLHYWNERFSNLIAVAPRQGGPGPFQQHLTAMASDQGALQSTILSMAANHLALASNDPSLKIRAYHHQQNAIISLQDLIKDPVDTSLTAEPALATILMMQISARLFSEGETKVQAANHLMGAKAMVARRGAQSNRHDSSRMRFLLSLFAYHDILSSIPRGSRPLIEHSNDFVRVEDDPSLQDIAKILHVVAQISELQELVKNSRHASNEPHSSGQIALVGAGIERSLFLLDDSNVQTAQHRDIQLTTRAFRHAAFIYLYRVWKNIGAPNPVTQYHTQQCLAYIEQVPVDSSLVASHLWPLWTAGCEAVIHDQRNFVRNRCLDMFRTRLFPSWRQIVRDIEDVWNAKDLEKIVSGDSGMTRIDCIQVILKQKGREVELA